MNLTHKTPARSKAATRSPKTATKKPAAAHAHAPKPEPTPPLRSESAGKRELRARPRDDSGDAFLPDVARHDGVIVDDVEGYAETFIANATAAEDIALEASDEAIVDEVGGPFVEDDAPASQDDLDNLSLADVEGQDRPEPNRLADGPDARLTAREESDDADDAEDYEEDDAH